MTERLHPYELVAEQDVDPDLDLLTGLLIRADVAENPCLEQVQEGR